MDNPFEFQRAQIEPYLLLVNIFLLAIAAQPKNAIARPDVGSPGTTPRKWHRNCFAHNIHETTKPPRRLYLD